MSTPSSPAALNAAGPVGLVGLGAMGRGVAANLLRKGFTVHGRDLNPDALDWLRGQGGTPAPDMAALARECRVVVCFVVNDAQTEAVLWGESGLAPHLQPGTVLITCSTLPPAYVQSLGERLAARGVDHVDAPVTGGKVGAERGSLTIMIAGAPHAVERARPVLQAFGERLFVLGDRPGMGSQMKVINQLLCGVHIAAAAEALALARRNGLPLDTTLEVLRSGSAASWMLGDRGPRMVAQDFGNVTSAVDIFVKDLGLVLDAARDAQFPARLAQAAFAEFIAASGNGWGRLDDSAVICNHTGDPAST